MPFKKKVGPKVCSGCGEMDETCFSKKAVGYKGLSPICKMCAKAKGRKYEKANSEKIAKRKKKYYEDNYEKISEKSKEYGKKYRKENSSRISEYKRVYNEVNSERISERGREYRRANSDIYRCASSKRRAVMLKALPLNIDWGEIRQIYADCSKLEDYHVDHIIPLQGKLPDGARVMGAHRHENLQIIKGIENRSKQNHVTYEDLAKAIEGVDYIHVPDDYFETIKGNKYPHIGFDVM